MFGSVEIEGVSESSNAHDQPPAMAPRMM
jgi:hypothetical protein